MLVRVLDKENTGKRIRQLRMDRHLTVEQLADLLGLESVQAIYKWQRSDSMPTIDNLVILSSLLNVSLDDIVCTREIEESRELSFHFPLFLCLFPGLQKGR